MMDAPAMAAALRDLLGLSVPPIALSFLATPPDNVPPFGGTRPAPLPDGRTGAVPAGCVFWMHATERAFATVAEDHGNCSVGSVTHGFSTLAEVGDHGDVAALLQSGWVDEPAVMGIPSVAPKPAAIVYAPLSEAPLGADIVFLRLTGKQVMLLHDAWPAVDFEGKPQCHIIPLAMQRGKIAISSGCMLSRVRTGMSNNEMTCAIPASLVPALVERLTVARAADLQVAAYAAEDARRFA